MIIMVEDKKIIKLITELFLHRILYEFNIIFLSTYSFLVPGAIYLCGVQSDIWLFWNLWQITISTLISSSNDPNLP